jgi:hypothetical protein
MTIKFLHTPLERIDRLCQEEEKVEVMINTYKIEYYSDGTSQEVQTGGFGGTIRSSKDLFQFDDEDMKQLADHVKESLR